MVRGALKQAYKSARNLFRRRNSRVVPTPANPTTYTNVQPFNNVENLVIKPNKSTVTVHAAVPEKKMVVEDLEAQPNNATVVGDFEAIPIVHGTVVGHLKANANNPTIDVTVVKESDYRKLKNTHTFRDGDYETIMMRNTPSMNKLADDVIDIGPGLKTKIFGITFSESGFINPELVKESNFTNVISDGTNAIFRLSDGIKGSAGMYINVLSKGDTSRNAMIFVRRFIFRELFIDAQKDFLFQDGLLCFGVKPEKLRGMVYPDIRDPLKVKVSDYVSGNKDRFFLFSQKLDLFNRIIKTMKYFIYSNLNTRFLNIVHKEHTFEDILFCIWLTMYFRDLLFYLKNYLMYFILQDGTVYYEATKIQLPFELFVSLMKDSLRKTVIKDCQYIVDTFFNKFCS
jgi:hypothetical protein